MGAHVATLEQPNRLSLHLMTFTKDMPAHSNFGYDQTTVTATSRDEPHAFLSAEVTGWGIPAGELPVRRATNPVKDSSIKT
jgi:hypothetical protein